MSIGISVCSDTSICLMLSLLCTHCCHDAFDSVHAAPSEHACTSLTGIIMGIIMGIIHGNVDQAIQVWLQAKQSDAQELTSGQASTMARNEQVVDTLTGE